MKVCIVAIAKNENHYIKEWVDWHLSIGVDHIYIYDNNDTASGEQISDVIKNYDNVTIISAHDKMYAQRKMYRKAWKKYHDKYDWFIYIDCDEFIRFSDSKMDIHSLLNSHSNDEIVRLNWKTYDDNDILDVVNDNWSITRFKRPIRASLRKQGKSILNTHLLNTEYKIYAHGMYDTEIRKFKAVTPNGKRCLNKDMNVSNVPDYSIAWIDHYRQKSIGEFIRQKYFRTDASSKEQEDKKSHNLDEFWKHNRKTKQKEEYAKKLIAQLSK